MLVTLNGKIFIAIFATLFLLIAFSGAVLMLIVAPRFDDMDRSFARQNSDRVRAAINAELANLAEIASEWGNWDDTDDFIGGGKPGYVADNIYPKAIENLRVNVVQFYDDDRHLVFGEGSDYRTGAALDFPGLADAEATWLARQAEPARSSEITTGVIVTPRGPLLVADAPILSSRRAGPSRGRFLIGRLLDPAEIAALSRQTAAPVEIRAQQDPGHPIDGASPQLFGHGKVLYAAFVIPALDGSGLVVTTSVHRNAARVGLRAIGMAMAILAVLTLGGLFVILQLINRLMLRPLTGLESHFIRVGQSGDLAAYPDEHRQDQFGSLAREFNRMIRTLTQLRRQEAVQSLAYKAAMEAALAADAAKTRFLAHMSHELRTPLNAIIGFSDMMSAEVMGPIGLDIYRGYVEDINLSGQNLLSIVDHLLDLSRTEPGASEEAATLIDVGEMLAECRAIMEPQMQRGEVSVSCPRPDDLRVIGDPRLFRQMILNLFGDAIKFTPPGGSVTATALLDDAGRIRVSIADTGIGMAEAESPAAPEVFGQIPEDPMIRSRGIGLGLSVTKRFMAQHGGTLEICSRSGEGTRVILTFPAERSRVVVSLV